MAPALLTLLESQSRSKVKVVTRVEVLIPVEVSRVSTRAGRALGIVGALLGGRSYIEGATSMIRLLLAIVGGLAAWRYRGPIREYVIQQLPQLQ